MTTEHAPVVLDIAGLALTDADRRRLRAHVSVTDEADYAASFVVVEQETAS